MKWLGFTPTAETTEHLSFYCVRCGEVYKSIHGKADIPHHHHWHFYGGLCGQCPPCKWNINYSIECMALVGWRDLPEEIVRYQFDNELFYYTEQEKLPCGN